MSKEKEYIGPGGQPTDLGYNRLIDLVAGLLNSTNVQYYRDSRGVHVRRIPSENTGLDKLGYCKSDAEAVGTMSVYPGVDVPLWDAVTTFGQGANCEGVGTGIEYTSVQAGNLNHIVTDTDWWAVVSVSIECETIIINGTTLKYASPRLHKSDAVFINQVDVNGTPTWYIVGQIFNGARFGT